MSKLVVQVDIHPDKLVGENFHNLSGRTRNEELIAKSKAKMEKYAKKFGADYHLIDEPLDPTRHPWCERFRLFHEERYDKYEVILYTDIDVIPTRHANNVFMYGSRDSFVAANRHKSNEWIVDLWRQHAVSAMPDVDLDTYVKYQMNSGVLLIGQDCREYIHSNTDWDRMDRWYWKDQMELSYICMKAEQEGAFKFKRMPWEWNDDTISGKGKFHHHKGEARKRSTHE